MSNAPPPHSGAGAAAYECPPPPYYETNTEEKATAAGAGYPKQAPPPPTWGSDPPPPPGWGPYPPTYGTITVEPAQHSVTQVILVGGCPVCRIGVLEEDFSFLGILCAIFFFPLGVLCCLALRDKRCTNCGARF